MNRVNTTAKHLNADGVHVKISVSADAARIDVRTTYPMSDEIRFEVMLAMKEAALRKQTQPQVNTCGGFCTHIDKSKAMLTAWKIIRVARLDQLHARNESIYIPKQYVR